MPTWLVYHFASGAAYFTGATMIGLAGAVSFSRNRLARVCTRCLALVGVIFVVASATPSPFWLYAIWGAAVFGWLLVDSMPRRRQSRMAAGARPLMLAMCLGAAGIEARHFVAPSLAPAAHGCLYVVGDSISAGIGPVSEHTWPAILADRRSITVVNLARPGARTVDAVEQARGVEAPQAVVLIEIGGNDLLRGVPAEEYEKSLRRLLTRLSESEHTLVMCELPLPPLCNGYGRAQRRLAAEFDVTLIPKRMFASVLSASDTTIDGLHLSESGHQRMAEVVWKVVGRGFARQ
jgi:acyl-CoA thioesterase-1